MSFYLLDNPISYTTWKTIYKNNSDSVLIYHVSSPNKKTEIWLGNKDFIFYSHINLRNYNDWLLNFSSASIEVSSNADAQSLIYTLSSLIIL